ncbi:MAG: amidohydrolase [Clostridiales bacterium]|nr:amidohydrolase [Clostridiales bacterium]
MKHLFINGTIFTGEEALQQAFAVEDGRFTAVGSTGELLALRRDDDIVTDLEGRFVCAGFNDSHMHLLNYGFAMTCCDLMQHTSSITDLQEGLRAFIAARGIAPGGWVRGRGWNQDYFADGHGLPTRADLDAVSAEHPICIVRCCGHCLVVNSRAIELLELNEDAPQPYGGHYDLAAGLFEDSAMSMVYTRLPAPTRGELKAMLRSASAALNRCGVTSCQTDDLCAFENLDYEEIIAAYRELQHEGGLTVRVYEQAQLPTLEGLRGFLAKGYNTGWGDDMFRIGPLKMLGDGSLGARTAFLREDYADAPGQRGLAIFTQQQFDDMVSLAHASGMQVAIHAIGDGVLDRVLNAYEKAFSACPRADHRSGVVHVQITRPEQLRRMRELNLHAYIQSIFLDYDINIVESRVGSEVAGTSYAFHTMKELGLHVSNGTDCPVEMPVALRGIQCAVTRRTLSGKGPYRPEEAMTVPEALRSYTIEGAHASFEENVKGHIAPGYLADFTVLDGDPLSAAPERIGDIHPLQTWLGGKQVY